tara:strand:- start:21 stop:605 length:585 start_codon:yes stop_codon:yes gene_type:complete
MVINKILICLAFILTLSFQSSTKADDIRDFQIEGISIGDSLLDYFTKEKIIKEKKFYKLGGKLLDGYSKIFKMNNNKVYDNVVLYFESDDRKYIIQGISGRKYYKNNINECYKAQDKIVNEIKLITPNAKIVALKKDKHSRFKNSYIKKTIFFLNDADISIFCYDYSKKDTTSMDRLSVIIRFEKMNIYLRSTK